MVDEGVFAPGHLGELNPLGAVRGGSMKLMDLLLAG